MAQVFESRDGSDTVFSRRKSKAGVHQIEQVMRDAFPLFRGRSCICGDVLDVSFGAVLIAGISSTESPSIPDIAAPAGGHPPLVYATASLVVQGEIIQENEP